ncbi:hypothetical protein PISMIDRAFT_101712 [Pisolithus microcarpus 441]|uniref:Uncharacterized protein n=1 Tax=Pisolithus microcarpus 441 TaxID=765257 RepID=A0A0C9ZSX4_9AGAM|nr:hypothetical protein PISMIDRAFT_101712 [Pisolithus microcarpus 441]
MSGDWAWEQAVRGLILLFIQNPLIESHQDRILADDPTTARATLVPVILSSDKTTVLVATGQTDYYPLYLSIGNMHNTVHRAHCNAIVLIKFLAMPKSRPTSFDFVPLLRCHPAMGEISISSTPSRLSHSSSSSLGPSYIAHSFQ